MAVRVGNSYVSETARSYAQSQPLSATDSTGLLKELAEKFPELKIQAGTAPFSGTGMNNVMISPKVLREMIRDPDKRQEYEALLYDIQQGAASRGTGSLTGRRVKAQGFVITDDGGLRGWGISENENRTSRSRGQLFFVAKPGVKNSSMNNKAKKGPIKQTASSSAFPKATPAFRLEISKRAQLFFQRG